MKTLLYFLIIIVSFNVAYRANGITITINETAKNRHEVIFAGSIERNEEHKYKEFFSLLDTATEKDVIIIYITGPGGDVDVLLTVISKLLTTKAYTKSIVVDYAASASAVLTCYANEADTSKANSLMYHLGYILINDWYNIGELADRMNQIRNEHIEIMSECVKKGTMTQEELDRVAAGEDVYVKLR